MRSLFLGIAVLAASLTISVQPSDAGGRQFCLSGNKDNGGIPECSFVTWEQCRASVAGADKCEINPWYSGPREKTYRGAQRRQAQRY